MASVMTSLRPLLQTILGLIFRRPLAGVSIIPILSNGQIVLVQRRDTGQWALPGGLVEWGQDITATARRELREETGLDLIAIDRLVGVYSSPSRDPRMHSVCITVAAQVEGHLLVEDRLEILSVQAFAPDHIPVGKLAHDHDQQLQDYFSGHFAVA
jgi:ADP-ribose pyrophosphatase YjhB (NUDIX family)